MRVNQRLRTICIVQDLTAFKKAEDAIRESEHRCRKLIEHARAGIFLQDMKSGRLIDVNPRLCELFGCTAEEFLGDLGGGSLFGEGRPSRSGAVPKNTPVRAGSGARKTEALSTRNSSWCRSPAKAGYAGTDDLGRQRGHEDGKEMIASASGAAADRS